MNDPRQTARELLQRNSVTLERLWLRYWAQGGNAPEFEFEALVYEVLVPYPFDLRILGSVLEDLDVDSAR